MSLRSEAQIIVLEPSENLFEGHHDHSSLYPKYEEEPMHVEEVIESSSHESDHPIMIEEYGDGDDDKEDDISIIVEELSSDLPGAPKGTKDPEPEMLEVVDNSSAIDENNAKDTKWNWSKGKNGKEKFEGFIPWIKDMVNHVPKHSGSSVPGLHRAISYLTNLFGEISKAMRLDLEGELDGNKIEEVSAAIENGIEMLEDRLDKVNSSKKKSKKKKADNDIENVIIKEAQKITGIQGIYVTVPLLISRIARSCINGAISEGHDINDLFQKQSKQYNLDKREQAEVVQLLEDMGYTIKNDRSLLVGEEFDPTSNNNGDFSAFYHG
jgi:hypothetical protein